MYLIVIKGNHPCPKFASLEQHKKAIEGRSPYDFRSSSGQ